MKRMANTPATDQREGHGDESPVPSVSKGTFMDVGVTYTPLDSSPFSVNKKSGGPSGTEAGGISSGPAFGR
jgi:hypothetical protein